MRLLYTLRYGSYAGNLGGDLRLFFTRQNANDWQPSPPAPPPGVWIPPPNQGERITLSSGDSLEFSLYPVTDGIPGQLYLFGAITVTTAAMQGLGGPLGQGSATFAPNQPLLGFFKDRIQGNNDGIAWDIGFEMAVPWNGVSADCTGQWWAIWNSKGPEKERLRP